MKRCALAVSFVLLAATATYTPLHNTKREICIGGAVYIEVINEMQHFAIPKIVDGKVQLCNGTELKIYQITDKKPIPGKKKEKE